MPRWPKLVLASESPRRRELLKLLCSEFEVVSSQVPETTKRNEAPREMVQRLAEAKAKAVQALRPHATIVGADTVVLCGRSVLGKPKSQAGARNMLFRLSGKTHRVLTGLCVLRDRQCCLGLSETKVQFSPLAEAEIERYLESDEPFDKAGAYAIQGFAARYVERIDGCYFNVVGLPISLLYQMLRKVGYPLYG
jgi:nucleoside triphosphate pyrophosphatase